MHWQIQMCFLVNGRHGWDASGEQSPGAAPCSVGKTSPPGPEPPHRLLKLPFCPPLRGEVLSPHPLFLPHFTFILPRKKKNGLPFLQGPQGQSPLPFVLLDLYGACHGCTYRIAIPCCSWKGPFFFCWRNNYLADFLFAYLTHTNKSSLGFSITFKSMNGSWKQNDDPWAGLYPSVWHGRDMLPTFLGYFCFKEFCFDMPIPHGLCDNSVYPPVLFLVEQLGKFSSYNVCDVLWPLPVYLSNTSLFFFPLVWQFK